MPVITAEPNWFQPLPALSAPGAPLIGDVLYKAETLFSPEVLQILSMPVIVTAVALLFRKLNNIVAFALLLRNPVTATVDGTGGPLASITVSNAGSPAHKVVPGTATTDIGAAAFTVMVPVAVVVGAGQPTRVTV